MRKTTRRTLLRTASVAALSPALRGPALDAQYQASLYPHQMDMRIVGGAVAVGAGLYSALRAGIPPTALNLYDYQGVINGMLNQIRCFGGWDTFMNYYGWNPPALDPGYLYANMTRHIASPYLWTDVNAFCNYKADLWWPYVQLGQGWQGVVNAVGSVPTFFMDQVPGRYSAASTPKSVMQELARMKPLEYPNCTPFDPDPFCVNPPPTPPYCDPTGLFCVPDPLPGYPDPTGFVPLPWVDPNSPVKPIPRHGISKSDICYWSGIGVTMLKTIGGVYAAQVKLGNPKILTLSGEIIIETAAAGDVAAALAIAGVIIFATQKLTCP